ncbi:hypothetical protein HETIRDRAFT_451349 [Heterobasidion irregulare TC 32-1]|uniref:Uncharacterized protein n=1 Tax=Heterobasidion irregulare (strain TC 32-1) TaxID=747525 RepID=W4K939_HETIT|nr:uncharacterized protein HETIRDRAFT_451349 [Heterobasidion irregulare TC 32-1]ETW81601.1 hypothetical protein HETIRDRAFT_451349 [Heterobasidion irregulare TC 32-1]
MRDGGPKLKLQAPSAGHGNRSLPHPAPITHHPSTPNPNACPNACETQTPRTPLLGLEHWRWNGKARGDDAAIAIATRERGRRGRAHWGRGCTIAQRKKEHRRLVWECQCQCQCQCRWERGAVVGAEVEAEVGAEARPGAVEVGAEARVGVQARVRVQAKVGVSPGPARASAHGAPPSSPPTSQMTNITKANRGRPIRIRGGWEHAGPK